MGNCTGQSVLAQPATGWLTDYFLAGIQKHAEGLGMVVPLPIGQIGIGRRVDAEDGR